MSPAAPTRLGVLGWPVRHSRSPRMQTAALEALGLDGWTYDLLPCPPEALAELLAALPGAGFVGANVTIPHKEAAVAAAASATDAARAIGAANTLTVRDDGTLHADNTDAPGTIDALGDLDPAGSRALVLGAGGSARAVAWALKAAGADVGVRNRSHERAVQLAADLGVRAESPHEPVHADLLVHCTSLGLDGRTTPLIQDLGLAVDDLSRCALVVDLVYRPDGPTPLLRSALDAGVLVVDGLEVLVRQGALSLEAWTGRPAPLDVMRATARARA